MAAERRRGLRMALLLGLATGGLVAVIVGALAYASHREITGIFDVASADARQLAVDNAGRQARLLAANTAASVQPDVVDHNYSYIRGVLGEMRREDPDLLYIGVFDAEDEPIEQNGDRTAAAGRSAQASARIMSGKDAIGRVDLVYGMAAADARIREAERENRDQRTASIRTLVIGGAVVLGVGVVVAVLIGVWMTRPVRRMAHAAVKLGAGDFGVRVDAGGPAELRQLATTFNTMASELRASLRASVDRAALEREVAIAHRLQREMMPPEGRVVSGGIYEIASWYAPTGKMGGDWWTIASGGDGKPITVLVGDVMGHGIPAALFTAAAKSAHRTATLLGADGAPDRLLSTIDGALRGFDAGYTMSCCAVRFDPAPGAGLQLSVGAHPPPLYFGVTTGGAAAVVDADGPVLGDQEPGAMFHTVHHPFAAGDLLVLFTDGIIEAPDKRGRMFGLRRLADTVRGQATRDLPEVLAAIKSAFAAHVGDGDVVDDVTVVLVRQLPESRAP